MTLTNNHTLIRESIQMMIGEPGKSPLEENVIDALLLILEELKDLHEKVSKI